MDQGPVDKPMRRTLAIVLLAYAAVLLVVLFNPSPAVGSELVSRVVSVGLRLHVPAPFVVPARIEFGLNVLAFMPLSLLGSLLRPKVPLVAWIAVGFCGSLLVEASQLALPDRYSTNGDVVANTLGAAVGAAVAWGLRRVLRQ